MAFYGNKLVTIEDSSLLREFENFNNIINSFNINESSIILEANLSFKKMVEGIKKLWSKFKEWFKQQVKKIKNWVAKVKDQISKFFKQFQSKIDDIEDDDKDQDENKNYRTYNYDEDIKYKYYRIDYDIESSLANASIELLFAKSAYMQYMYDDYNDIDKKDIEYYDSKANETYEKIKNDISVIGPREAEATAKYYLKRKMTHIANYSQNGNQLIINLQSLINKLEKNISKYDNNFKDLDKKLYSINKEYEEYKLKINDSSKIVEEYIKKFQNTMSLIQNDIKRFKDTTFILIEKCQDIYNALQINKNTLLKLYSLYNYKFTNDDIDKTKRIATSTV